MVKKEWKAVFLALAAALFYSINIPLSKILIEHVGECMTAGLLYLGAGIAVAAFMPFEKRKRDTRISKLEKKDLPYIVLMVLLDIVAPILLMKGLSSSSASLATLVNNFEIVSTSLIAAVVFKEKISSRCWLSILLITASTIILSFTQSGESRLSPGLLLVLLATISWGMENNCTRMLSEKRTSTIVFIKGIFSGSIAIIIALLSKEPLPEIKYALLTMLLGSVAYGVSIFLYIRAQSMMGAARTSAFYAINPFLGSILSAVILKESLTQRYIIAFLIMALGTSLMITDTLSSEEN